MSQSIEKIFYPLHHANPMRFYEGEDGIVFEYDDGDAARNFVPEPYLYQPYTCVTVRVWTINRSMTSSTTTFPDYKTMMEKDHPLDHYKDYVVTEEIESLYYFTDYELRVPGHVLASSWIVFDKMGEEIVGSKEYIIVSRRPSVLPGQNL